MSPEELHDEMVNKAEFDDAYVNTTANTFNTMAPEDIARFMVKLSESQASYTTEQRANLQKLNLALAQKPAFNESLKRFSDWRATQSAASAPQPLSDEDKVAAQKWIDEQAKEEP
jgi:hypothetical protein